MTCRICRGQTRTVLDLGPMPLANRLKPAPDAPEKRFPLAVEFCRDCGNLQLTHCVAPQDLYDDDLYVTPTSPSLEAHSVNLVYHMQAQGYLGDDAFLLEFGSNIGHFLKYAQTRVGRVLGIDPARAIVEMANARGVPTVCDYFGPEVAKATVREHGRAQVVAGRHCAAHNADPHALIDGRAAGAGAGRGVRDGERLRAQHHPARRDRPDLPRADGLLHRPQRAAAVRRERPRARRPDADRHPRRLDGVLRGAAGSRPVRSIVAATIARERAILSDALLALLPATLERWRVETRALLDRFRTSGRSVWMYGGSAKAATFINAVGIDERDIAFCADSTEEKIGRFLPGTGIEIRPEAEAIDARPDYYLVTAWNYRNELIQKVRAGGNAHSGFAVPFPEVQIIVTSAADIYAPSGTRLSPSKRRQGRRIEASMPEISVIIPCLNGAETLAEALGSLVAQRWDRPGEIVFADNGSTDAVGGDLHRACRPPPRGGDAPRRRLGAARPVERPQHRDPRRRRPVADLSAMPTTPWPRAGSPPWAPRSSATTSSPAASTSRP